MISLVLLTDTAFTVKLADMKETVLITGGAGFIGSSLYKAVKSSYKAVILDNFNDFYSIKQKMSNLGIDSVPGAEPANAIIKGDIRDQALLAGIMKKHDVSIVVHCAAMPGVLPSFENPGLYYSVNTEGTLSVAESARKAGIRRMVFLSSSSVYGSNEKMPFSEDMEPKPISVYGDTKRNAEEILKTYNMHYNMGMTVLRLFTVYGPAQRPDLALHKFCLNHRAGRETSVYGSLDTKRDYTYIDDAVSGIISAMRFTKTDYEIFNIASGREVAMGDMLQLLEKHRPGFRYSIVPPVKGDMKETFGDIRKARKMLEYNPAMSFRDGAAEFIKWFGGYYSDNA